MAKTQMNPDEAQRWINQIEALNQELDGAVNGAQNCMQTVQESSSGSVVDELCSGIDEMAQAAKTLVTGFGEMVSAVNTVITAGLNAVDEIGGLVKVAAAIIGL